METQVPKKPRIVCLHGKGGSGAILKKRILQWPNIVLDKLDLVFLDGPYQLPFSVREDIDDPPPYYSWFQSYEDFTECIEYLEANMIKYGPFDGVLGFSQGAVTAASLPGMQREGVALTKIPTIKFLIIIAGAQFGGSKFGLPSLAVNAFSVPITCPSLHFIGEMDSFSRDEGKALLKAFVDPVVIHHPEGHVIPQLDNNSLEVVLTFIEKISQISKQENGKGSSIDLVKVVGKQRITWMEHGLCFTRLSCVCVSFIVFFFLLSSIFKSK